MTTADTSLTQPATAEAASRYQRLRGHLAALKLHAAAEALPSVMDAAATKGLSLTAALERLLAIEVDATEARRLAAGCASLACPPPPPWTASTSTPPPGWTANSSMNWPLAATWNRPPTFCSSVRPGRARRTWRWGWPGPPPTPATAPTSPPPPTWPPAATAPRSRVAGPPPCGSTPDRPCWPSTSSATCRYPTRPPQRCFRLSRNDI
jgi:hypothetical protein